MNRISRKKEKPPLISRWLINRVVSPYVEYPALGDMEEEFDFICEEDGVKPARQWYRRHALKSLPQFTKQLILWSIAMFTNYLKITYRNLRKHKSYSFINISGLALGIACCLLMIVYVADELSYDTFHEHADNIYRLAFQGEVAGTHLNMAVSSPLLAPDLMRDYPEVINFVRLKQERRRIFSYEDKRFYESSYLFSDNSIFQVFTFPLVKGDPTSALTTTNTAVVTESTAKKYFGEEDPIGKILQMDNTTDLTITGIAKDVPGNSHFTFDLLISMETSKTLLPSTFADNPGNRLSFNFHTYVLMQEGVDLVDMEAKIADFNEKTVGPLVRQMGGKIRNYLQPLTDIHLHSNIDLELEGNSDIGYVYAFSMIAFFILVIACINFMNLSTARSANRAKEVGMRKVFGAFKKQLTKQFLAESIIFSVISLLVALILIQLALPYFNNLAAKSMRIDYLEMPWLLGGMLLVILFIGFAAGSYPALFLSAFRPVQVLKGDMSQGTKSSRFRSILVVLQFAISITLIIGTSVISSQLHYMKNKRLGFDKERLLTLQLTNRTLQSTAQSIKTELASLNGVSSVAISNIIPGTGNNTQGYFPEGSERRQVAVFETMIIDTDFLDTYGIEVASGRNFSQDITTDPQSAILINETAAKKLGWDEPIGKTIERPTNAQLTQFTAYTVVGVVKDFHSKSLYQTIEPQVIHNSNRGMSRLSVKLKSDDISNTMNLIRDKWSDFAPGVPFEYAFMDESFDSQYRAEEQLGTIFNTFAALAVLIGCLGLFGLASFTAEQRTKEIGIRKILGSKISSIILLLGRDFSILVVLANIIAWPVAYYAMNSWLSGFPYRTGIGLGSFFLAAFLAMLIALITVSYQTFKAAYMNPVKALRYE